MTQIVSLSHLNHHHHLRYWMEPVYTSLLSSVDCKLVCTDGQTYPCHSLFLKGISKEFASVHASTEPKSNILLDVPFKGSGGLAKRFLTWVYERSSPPQGRCIRWLNWGII